MHEKHQVGNTSLTALGPKIWNQLPAEIKSETSLIGFREYIKIWFGPECKCNGCRTII